MPTILETDIGEIEMPDNWSADQIKEWAQTRLPTVREGLKKGRAADIVSRIPRDLAIAGANVIQGAARGGQLAAEALVGPTRLPAEKPATASEAKIASNIRQLALQSAMSAPEEGVRKVIGIAPQPSERAAAAIREEALKANPVYQYGTQTKEAARDVYAVNPALEESIPAKLSAAVSSTIPVLATAPLGVPAAMLTYGAMSGQQGAEEAIAEGRPDKADEAYLAYAGLGALSEAALGYPMALLRTIRAARRANVPAKEFGKAFKQTLADQGKKVGKEIVKASGREAVQESTEQLGQNVAAQMIGFDPDRELTQGVWEAFWTGGAVGGLFGGAGGVAQTVDQSSKNQLGRLLKDYGLDLRPIDPRLADVAAREAMRPENAQRTVVPAMLDQPATGWAVGEDGTRLSELTLPPVEPAPTPAPPTPAPEAEPRRRRPIAPATEPPRFRPPTPNVPTPRPAGAPAFTSPVRENGGQTSIVLKDGTAIVGGRIHAQTFSKAVELNAASEDALSNGTAAFTRPDGTTWDLSGNPVLVKRIVTLSESSAGLTELPVREQETAGRNVLTGPPSATAEEGERKTGLTSSATPVTQEVPSAVQVRKTETLPASETPETRPQVGAQVRVEAETTPQAPGQITSRPTGAGGEVTTEQAQEPQKKADEERLESEMVQRARSMVLNSASPEEAYERLIQFYNQIPRLGTRTAASKTAQAYSTPPPLAFLAGQLIGIDTGKVVGESTAGNGMLLIGTHPEATLVANELDPNRNARLKTNFRRAQVSMLDATTPDFFDYFSQWKPDRIIINPPFGGRVEEGGKAKQRFPIINAATAKADTPSIDLAIALNSLEAMAPNGRAVVIIGSKTGTMGPQFSPNASNRAKDYNRQEMLEFFQRFNVTDWFTVSGELYKKMGAGWPVDVIVINGKGTTPPASQGGFQRPWVTPPKVYNSWAELKEKLNETTPTSIQPGPEPAAAQTPTPPTIRRPTGGGTSGSGGAPARPTSGGGGPAGPAPAGTPKLPGQPRTPSPVPAPTRPVQPKIPRPPDSRPPVVPPSSPEPTPEGAPTPETAGVKGEAGAGAAPLEQGSNLLNVPIKAVSKLGGANLVAPSNLADSMARAVIELERETGQKVDDYVADKLGWTKTELKNRFSSAQSEVVGLFIRNIETRKTGIINSDQTGVGKGRTVAAAIHYALKNGKTPIFVTANKQLYTDMAGRDLPSIGITNFNPFITDSEVQWTNGKGEDIDHKLSSKAQRDAMAQIAKSGKLPPGVHGIFTTYNQLQSDKAPGWKEDARAKARRKRGFQSRPDGPRFQMLRALAPNAIFFLDEAHRAAGLDSDVGLALQSILPDAAGVYYASATFAKRPDNLSLYALGTAMKKSGLKRDELASAFTSGGVPLQQALTSMLTESGEFVRREQNMKGVDFNFESSGTDPQKEAELADTYTSFLRDLFQLSEQVNDAAQGVVDGDNQVRPLEDSVDLSSVNFGARLFNLSSQYLFALRADATIQKSIEALKNNQKPFIAVYNTMAGPISDLQERGLPIGFGGMLEREMLKMLEVKVRDPLAEADPVMGTPAGTRIIILKPEDLSDGGSFFYGLRDQIRSTDFSQMPISPIDTIKTAIKKAGYTIGELTGRKGEVDNESEEVRFTKREIIDRNKILADFNNGALDALIVNSSADTGVSAHTDPKFKDQRQRHMIIAQPNPDINGFMQIVGRVMRFGQTKVPTYSIMGSSLAVERRFNTMLRAKLNSLNANTTADTESTITQGGLTADIFNFIGDGVVANVMASNPDLAALALINLPDPTQPEGLDGFARKATGHFVLLPNADADALWQEIAETYSATIKALDDAGENPLKADVVDLRAKTVSSQQIQEGTGKTLFDGPVVLEKAEVKPPQPALTSQQALELAAQNREAAELKAVEWLQRFASARANRLQTMRQREATDAQVQSTIDNFQRTKEAVESAVRLLGEPVAVRSAVHGEIDFYAVPIGLMLKSDNTSDFSGASKHSLVLATNSIRRQITIPLSQLERIEMANIEAFDTERDQSGVRHIVTGNLLRGIQDATKIARGTSRPKVTIYSTSGGEVKTGILMAPGWRPEDGLRALGTVIKTSAEMRTAIGTGKLINAGPVLIRGDRLSIPSRNEFRGIWGDPQFNQLFQTSPIERRGEFQGELTERGKGALYDFLRSKGLTPTLQSIEAEGSSPKFSVTLEEPTGPAVVAEDILRAFPREQGFYTKRVSVTYDNGDISEGYLIKLPNGEAILVDPNRDRISFNAEKAADDWGLDPKIVAESGIARGSFVAGGARIKGISRVGLIELINTAGPSTLSHEKFHALFEMALTREDRKSILDRYKTEEKAAEAFRRSEGFTRGFWDKMRQFIERLANLFRGDAFAKLRAPMSPDFVSQPIAQGRKYSLETIYSNKENLEKFIQTPYISPEEAANLRQQAGARAALVPDQIADEIRGLNAADPIEKRMASLLEFVLRMHGLAPALEIQRILADTTIAPELKDAAISAVLRAIEHVRVQTTEVDDQLQQAMANLARMTKAMRKISGKQMIEAKAKETAARLVTGYRAYLTAQAATMPADRNLAAARQQVIRNLQTTLNRDEKQSPDATMLALQAITKRIAELPVAQGPEAVIEAIRSKNILKGVVGDSTIDMLLDEKPSGIAPLLLNPQTNEMLVQLAELQKKAETYAKQIETVEQAFRGKGEVTPVELKRFAETYRKFRNKQIDAAKAIAEMDKDLKKADESVQVYTRTKDILERLQNDPLFKAQLEAVANIPGGHIFNDIMSADKETRIKIYTSPLKQVDADGKVTQNEYRVLLAPDRQADEQTMREMALLVHEIEEYLKGEVEPIERRTLTELRDYIRKYQLIPMFATTVPGWSFETGHGIIDLNPLSWVQVIAGGRARAPRSEMEKMTLRAADMANTAFRVGDQSLNGYRLNRNNREYGDEVTKIAILNAVKSHAWDNTRIDHWNEWVLNPILASGQAPGQMRLGVGDYIPGTGIKITKEDMAAARMQKRFSQAIVQTTQGTAQNLPPLLKDNPILIEDEFAGRKTLRAALGTGPLTMARRFGEWARTFAHLWTNATAEGRRRLITDGRQFRLAVLGYVTTTNPEFENQSTLKPVYEEYTARALTDDDAQVQSLDHLIEQLAEIAVAKKIFPDTATAFPQIEQTLLQEIDQVVKAFNAQVVEQGHEGNTPQEVVAIASAKNSFTTARHRMVAPDTFYDYTLTSANDRIAFTAGAYQMFQSKQISALQDLRKALDIDLGVLEQKIADLKATGVPQSRAYREVQKQTKLEQEKGERRFTYMRLLQHKRTIDKMVDDLSKLVIDVRDPNDAAALLALSRFQSTMSSSLLASPMAIANNFFGGGIAAAWVTQQNLGRARLRLPFKAAVNLVSVLPKRLLATYPSKTLIGKLARSNMPMVRQMAQLLEETIANEIYFNTEAESWGLRAPPDMRNRLKAAKELPGTAGQIIWGKTPLIGGVFNRLESIPILRQLLIRLRDVSPRVIDELVNRATADIHRSETFGWLKLRAVEAFAAREELAKKTGANIGDFTNQDNLLTPEELGLPKSSGFRDIARMRQLFQLVGNLDSFLLDYYRRHKAAPEGEKAKVPLFTDPAAEGSVLFDMEAHGNIPTTGFTPPSMAGVGQSGVIKRLLFMFKNYVLRMGAQLERLPEKNLRDPKGWREAYGFWSIFLALAVFLFSGLLATETGVPLTRVVTGRAPSRVTAANVMADPDAAIVARYAGMALANNFPYYGGVISEMLGNPGYGSWWDAANMVPAAGLVRDISIAAKRIGQTGDPVFPALDFLGRWLPPASPAIRLYPGMEGDIQAKNAARALRVVGPSEGMELAGGGGGSYAQTPVTPEIRRLIAAAYQGDEAGVKRAFDAAVAAKEALGSADPVRAVKQSIAAAVPARRVFGRSITEAEEQQLVGQMSGGQRETYAGAQSAFDLINRTLGTNYRLTSAPSRSSTRTRRRRRLSGGRRLPSIRRSSRSRRSPFSRYRVRRVSGRRRRRSPSFSTSA